MIHKVVVHEFIRELAEVGIQLPVMMHLDVEAPDDLDFARKVVSETVVSKTGRRVRGLSHLAKGGFAVIVEPVDKAMAASAPKRRV